MKKIFLLLHISYDNYSFEEVYAASEHKANLYELAKKELPEVSVFENDENYNHENMDDATHFLITEINLV